VPQALQDAVADMQKSAGKRTPCAVPSLSRKPAQCQFQFQCQCQSNTSLTLLSQLLSGPPAAGHVLKLKPPSSLCLRAEFFCPPSFRSLSPRTSSDCPSLLIFYTLLCPVPDLALNTYIQYIYIQYIYIQYIYTIHIYTIHIYTIHIYNCARIE
jgi:hypothetical protein